MDEKYLISVTGIQEIDGEKEKVEVLTNGSLSFDGETAVIRYREYDSDNPSVSFENTIEATGDSSVTILRSLGGESRLILEKGRRHQCYYSTLIGEITVGVFTTRINNSLSPHSGELNICYTLDFNSGTVSNNELYIKITEKEG